MKMPMPRAHGFTLVELMIAITLGLMVIGGLTTLFVNNSAAQNEIERENRQIENGRYAMQVITDDLRLAGFYGEFDPVGPPALTAPGTLPDPCATDVTTLNSALALHVQGYDQGSALTCLTDRKDNTDIVVVRRVSTCAVGDTDCTAQVAGQVYLQASLCNNSTELDSTSISNYYVLDTDTSKFTLHKRNCSSTAVIRRYLTHIYYIATSNETGDGILTLKRAELDVVGGSLQFKVVPLAEGIEDMQIEYGMDTSGDGTPDSYNAAPGSIANWQTVTAAKVYLLARASATTPGHDDSKKYQLGYKADGTANITSATHDGYKRSVYQAVITMPNPLGRRSS